MEIAFVVAVAVVDFIVKSVVFGFCFAAGALTAMKVAEKNRWL